MLIKDLGGDLFAQVNLRLAVIPQMPRKLDDIEIEVIQRGASDKPVLRLYDKLMETVQVRPLLLLLGQGAIPALPAPFFARASNPAIENLPVLEFNDITDLRNQLRELDAGFLTPQLVADFVGGRDVPLTKS